MRYVELRRHTDNDDDQLSADGVRAAEEIGVSGTNPPYAEFVSTGAGRATQMAEILRAAAGQDEVDVVEDPGLRSAAEDRWRDVAKSAGKGADLDAMREIDHDLVETEARTLGAALRQVLHRLEDGGRALVIGHSPSNEAAVVGLTGETVPPMGKGSGVLVTESDGTYEVHPLD